MTLAFEVLASHRPDERARWDAAWQTTDERDVFAHPAYAPLFAAADDEVFCAVGTTASGSILMPLVVRPIGVLAWAHGREERDATTPYGYGGPVRSGTVTGTDSAAFFGALGEWCQARHIVSSFSRLSLFDALACAPPAPWEVQHSAENVVRSLDLEPEALWRDYAHKVRKNVTRARSHGLRVEVDENARELDTFLAIYDSTMDRRGAGSGYYFGRAFFETIATQMRESSAFFHVWHGAELVSTELVLRSRSYLYSFLGGTRAPAFELRPNDLLKHEVTTWGTERGMKAYVLGGGYTPGDGIFKYKEAFAPNGVVPFRTARVENDPAACAKLVKARAAAELAAGNEWGPRAAFFPSYRS